MSALRAVSEYAGVGFCYDTDRNLFSAPEDHGPLVIGWDTNVVIDFHTHGAAAIDGKDLVGVDNEYAADLYALADLINLWLIRDLRFVVLPRGFADYRGPMTERSKRNVEVMSALAEALTFQLYDWGSEDHRFSRTAAIAPDDLSAFPAGADRELIEEAVHYDVDVFLTRDRRVLRARETIARPRVLRPVELVHWLTAIGVQHFFGGRLDHDECPYDGLPPAPDLGRLGPLFGALSEDDDG